MSQEFLLRDPESFRFYKTGDPHPGNWVWKRGCLIKSVVLNDLTTVKFLLDSPETFKVTDTNGLTLLHVAILSNATEVFDFLLSRPECPLETKSDYGETPLLTSILVIDLDRTGNVKPGSDYFAWQLIPKSDIFQTDTFGNTVLSCAALKHHVKMAEVFVQNGVDVNTHDVCGNTALHHALDHDGANCLEFVMFLLLNGGDPRAKNKDDLIPFEKSVLHTRDQHLQELLFYYSYDRYCDVTTHLSVVLRLAECRSELVSDFEDVVITDETCDYSQLFYLDTDYLMFLAEKFKIESVLPMCSLREWSRNAVTLDKIQVLVAILPDAMLNRIQSEHDCLLFRNLCSSGLDLNEITEVMCYFLSYGLCVTDTCLLDVFDKYGRCPLFEVLLYMEIEMRETQRRIFPTLLYDFGADLECLENFVHCNVGELLGFFAGRKFKEVCLESYGSEIQGRIKGLPDVPLLQELARNVFRKFFVERLGIRSSAMFYTLIRNLEVSNVYKKIITLEKTLY